MIISGFFSKKLLLSELLAVYQKKATSIRKPGYILMKASLKYYFVSIFLKIQRH